MTLNELQGYVPGTVVSIWTQQIDHETLNIIHIHVNDTSDQVTIDVSYMHENESIKDFMQFKTDATGRPLKYKIIVKDCRVHTVLYNNDSVTEKSV